MCNIAQHPTRLTQAVCFEGAGKATEHQSRAAQIPGVVIERFTGAYVLAGSVMTKLEFLRVEHHLGYS